MNPFKTNNHQHKFSETCKAKPSATLSPRDLRLQRFKDFLNHRGCPVRLKSPGDPDIRWID